MQVVFYESRSGGVITFYKKLIGFVHRDEKREIHVGDIYEVKEAFYYQPLGKKPVYYLILGKSISTKESRRFIEK